MKESPKSFCCWSQETFSWKWVRNTVQIPPKLTMLNAQPTLVHSPPSALLATPHTAHHAPWDVLGLTDFRVHAFLRKSPGLGSQSSCHIHLTLGCWFLLLLDQTMEAEVHTMGDRSGHGSMARNFCVLVPRICPLAMGQYIRMFIVPKVDHMLWLQGYHRTAGFLEPHWTRACWLPVFAKVEEWGFSKKNVSIVIGAGESGNLRSQRDGDNSDQRLM